VYAWIEGVLAQASRPDAAARTRPFVANQDRLSDAFPEEQRVLRPSLHSGSPRRNGDFGVTRQ